MSETTKLTIEQIEAEHKELYAKFLPTLTTYTALASRALELQVEMYKLKLGAAFPAAQQREAALILSISARDLPAHVGEALAQLLREKQITISDVVFDPVRFTFHLYAK